MSHAPARRPSLEGRLRRLQGLLLAWYRSEGRALPWRRDPDPYRVLVSEVMLQQTRAARVAPAFEAFTRRFPTLEALAAAPLEEVLVAWRGLGYNRRAVALHRAATAIVERHEGRVPDTLEGLRALPGVGEYTARAVVAFAYGGDTAPVDTNVARVLVRAGAGRRLRRSEVQAMADALVPAGDAAAWTSALMDLGASTCTARRPRCDACPVAAACAWRLRATPDDPAAGRNRRPAAFAGSDRYHRGRLVDALRTGPLPRARLAEAAGVSDHERLAALTDGLVADGLARWDDDFLRLPR